MLSCVFGLMFVPLPAQQVIVHDLMFVLLNAQLCLRPHVCPPACSTGDIWPYLSPLACSSAQVIYDLILVLLYAQLCLRPQIFPLSAQQMIVHGLTFAPLNAHVSTLSASCLSPCLLNRWYMNLCQHAHCSTVSLSHWLLIRLVDGLILAPCRFFVQLSLRPHVCICTLLNHHILV